MITCPDCGCQFTTARQLEEMEVSVVKQVIVLNGKLGMSPGKAAAQACHASVGAFERSAKIDKASWHEFGVTKIVLEAPDAETILILAGEADHHNLSNFLVIDAGRTEVEPGSITALGIGPVEEKALDRITGRLPLY